MHWRLKRSRLTGQPLYCLELLIGPLSPHSLCILTVMSYVLAGIEMRSIRSCEQTALILSCGAGGCIMLSCAFVAGCPSAHCSFSYISLLILSVSLSSCLSIPFPLILHLLLSLAPAVFCPSSFSSLSVPLPLSRSLLCHRLFSTALIHRRLLLPLSPSPPAHHTPNRKRTRP